MSALPSSASPGIEFKNPLAGSILCYYPAEYQMGRKCLEMIRERCGVELNPDEGRLHRPAHRQRRAQHQHERDVRHHPPDRRRGGGGGIFLLRARLPLTGKSPPFQPVRGASALLCQRLFQDKLMPDTDAPEDLSFREMIVQNCPHPLQMRPLHCRVRQKHLAQRALPGGAALSDHPPQAGGREPAPQGLTLSRASRAPNPKDSDCICVYAG